MAEDTEDFGDFTSAFPPTTSAKDANSTPSAVTGVSQVNSSGKVDFFASFPPPSSTSGDQPLDLTSFDAFANHATGVCFDGEDLSGLAHFDIANINLDELKIPSPVHDPNTHLAGGVAFDIPPLPDEDFSDPGSPTVPSNLVQGQNNLFSTNSAKSESVHNQNGNTTGGVTSFPTTVPQPSGQKDKENAMDDSFGDFESSFSLKTDANLQTSTQPPSNTDINFGVFQESSLPPVSPTESVTQETKNNDQLRDLRGDSKPSEDFGEFGGFTTSSGIDKTEPSAFANFESTSTAKIESKESDGKKDIAVEESRRNIAGLAPVSDEVFTSFDHFQSSETSTVKSQQNDQFGDFGAFSNSSTANVNGQEDEFGNFGDFQTTTTSTADAPPQSTNATQLVPPLDGFGAFAESVSKDDKEFGTFGDFQTTTSSTAAGTQSTSATQVVPPLGDFGAFTDTMSKGDEEFGTFGDFQTQSSSTSAVSLSTATAPQAVAPPTDDFGAFAGSTSKEDDEFGDFSSTSDSTFGNFASSGSAPTLTTSQESTRHKGVESLISDCFPKAGSSQDKQVPHTMITQLTVQLSSNRSSSDSSENDTTSMSWGSLQKSVDFTIPLKKWDKSYMQDRYFGALKMDPMLVTKAGVLPLFNGMGNFESPLGGGTAMDLLESFGFEGGLETITQEPTSPTSGLLFRRRSSGSPGPALLDLSLPSSPKSPTNKNASFTLDADLLGLDLNPQSQSKQLTSIQELVLNERLVVNRSTWMDSELLELGGAGSGASAETSSQPSTPRTGKKQNSIELQLLQLGLDASKTSFANSSSHMELSLTARSTLGRLPDLSFMLQQERLVKSTYQPSQSEN